MKNKMLFLIVVGLLSMGQFASADDPVEIAKRYPPNLLNLKNEIESINWQIEQLESISAQYKASKDSTEQKISENSSMIDHLYKKVPTELSNIDKQVRSQLIGKAMEKLLETKLELATVEKSVEILERQQHQKNSSKIELRKKELEIDEATARKRLELAEEEYASLKELHKTGSLSKQQLMRARSSAEIAGLEYAKAKTLIEVTESEFKAEMADRLARERLSAVPIRARMKAIEDFIQRISASSSALQEVERLNRINKQFENKLNLIQDELFVIERRSLEMKTLKKLIGNRMSPNATKDNQKPDDK